MRRHLNKLTIDELILINSRLLFQGPLKNLEPEKKYEFAIDYTNDPYYGEIDTSNEKYVIRSQAKILLLSKSFPYIAIQTVVIVLDMNKPKERQKSILFISAENLGEDKKRQIILNDTDISKITDAYRNFSDVE